VKNKLEKKCLICNYILDIFDKNCPVCLLQKNKSLDKNEDILLNFQQKNQKSPKEIQKQKTNPLFLWGSLLFLAFFVLTLYLSFPILFKRTQLEEFLLTRQENTNHTNTFVSNPQLPAEGATHETTPLPAEGATHETALLPSEGATLLPAEGATHETTPLPSEGATHETTPLPSEGATHETTPLPSEGATLLPAEGATHETPLLPSEGANDKKEVKKGIEVEESTKNKKKEFNFLEDAAKDDDFLANRKKNKQKQEEEEQFKESKNQYDSETAKIGKACSKCLGIFEEKSFSGSVCPKCSQFKNHIRCTKCRKLIEKSSFDGRCSKCKSNF
jgi:hypothetical protein